jgi:hypothetical protein
MGRALGLAVPSEMRTIYPLRKGTVCAWGSVPLRESPSKLFPPQRRGNGHDGALH